jgi:DNA-binding response OmpR family regulator
MMPRLNGYQTCALLKSNAEYIDIPVVMLSSKHNLFDKARGRLSGSDEYLTKPFSPENLIKAIIQHTLKDDDVSAYVENKEEKGSVDNNIIEFTGF